MNTEAKLYRFNFVIFRPHCSMILLPLLPGDTFSFSSGFSGSIGTDGIFILLSILPSANCSNEL